MSVLVTMKAQGDLAKFHHVIETEPDRLRGLAEKARSAGCIHHVFGVGDGYVVVVDEWESADAFHGFITSPEIVAVMGDMGAQGEPEVDITEVVDSPDRF